MFKAPYYNRGQPHSVAALYSHSIQSIMAVFVSKPDLYLAPLKSAPQYLRQDVFFLYFRGFADKYYVFNLQSAADVDALIYFDTTAEQKAGSFGGAVGTGNKSRSYAKSFSDANRKSVEIQKQRVEYFEAKFGVEIRGDADARMFLGVPKIWDVLVDPAQLECMLRTVYCATCIASAYDDATMTAPIPTELEKQLVPLAIRNRVFQKWTSKMRNQITAQPPKRRPGTDDDEEEEDPLNLKPEQVAEPVRPQLVVSAEMQRATDEEDW